jgi:hypothetical protein
MYHELRKRGTCHNATNPAADSFHPSHRSRGLLMPYRRGSFALTPPSIPVFIISLVLAIVAFLMRYAGLSIPVIRAQHVFDVLAIAYIVMLVGVLVRRL